MDDAVALVLHGTGTDDRVATWLAAVARVPATARLVLAPDVPGPALAGSPQDVVVVDHVDALDRAAVVVLARTEDLPTPHALRRLVGAVASTGRPHRARTLPHTSSAGGPDAENVSGTASATVGCVALPRSLAAGASLPADPDAAAAACVAAGVEVALLPTAAVVAGPALPPPAVLAASPPYGHPAAIPGTALHRLLRDTGLTPPPAPPDDRPARPLLSVLTRTQGTRLLCLEETLTCLAAQSSRDFEVVLACHRTSGEALRAVRDLVGLLPGWLQDRTTVLEVERAGRSAPLNDALDVAAGRYAVVLDDDDVVSSDWVAAFAEAEARGPGTVLRSVALAQEVTPLVLDPAEGPAPVEVGPAHPVWPSEFSLVDHLVDNASPPMTFAVPRGVFDDLGQRFDESLDTTEDWDFLLRAAGVAGVTSTPAVTATYRVWSGEEGSRHLHDASEWAEGRAAVLRSLDDRVTLLPPGAARGVRVLHEQLEAERAEKFRFAGLNEQAAADLVTVNEAVTALRERIAQLEARIERLRQGRRRG